MYFWFPAWESELCNQYSALMFKTMYFPVGLVIIIIIVTEQTAQLICSGKKAIIMNLATYYSGKSRKKKSEGGVQINKEFIVTSRILAKLGVFVVCVAFITHANF